MKELSARERESRTLQRCAEIARGLTEFRDAASGREANVFRVAAMVLQSTFPLESRRLMEAADRYFACHPDELAPAVSIIYSGDVISLPRLRDGVTRLLKAT